MPGLQSGSCLGLSSPDVPPVLVSSGDAPPVGWVVVGVVGVVVVGVDGVVGVVLVVDTVGAVTVGDWAVTVGSGSVVVGTGVVSEALSEPQPAAASVRVASRRIERERTRRRVATADEVKSPARGLAGPPRWATLLHMPRAIWTGTISFGLVTVPVKLYAAVQSKTVRFNQLDGDNLARIQQKRVNAETGEEVPYERLVKGYEISPDRYVVIDPRELESIEPKKTKTIDIEDFVDLDDIDPIFYDHPYYLVPGTGGAKPYRLLLEAMRETNKVGIARVVIRSKEQLVALRPIGDVLGMTTLNFADEIVDADDLDEVPAAEDVKTTKRELDIAKQLVDSLASAWDPSQYHDSYREQVLEMIERKAAGEEIAIAAAPEEEAAPAPDLMAALKASLDAVRANTSDGDGKATSKPKRKPAAKKPGSGRAKAGAKS